ncbi:tripartite tricarboxylate transporter TctB family protein [Loktanella sp. DJP18]|uniref:tripartite tricarboxylate transporter TctB family protein n=1 Tax=Loktanella sp. DJP18 TaxID=3409788 RepID=UPI003BB58A25
MTTPEPIHHDGSSDALPGGYTAQRRPGELAFAIFLALASLGLLWNAYGIAGFSKLSSAGAIPMATAAVMVLTAVIVVVHTARQPVVAKESIARDILPGVVILFVGLLVGYAVLLRPFGFLPTSALFLIVGVKVLSRRGWGFTVGVSLASLLVIWLIFRIVFSVLMPAGIVPEAEAVQMLRNLFGGVQ